LRKIAVFCYVAVYINFVMQLFDLFGRLNGNLYI